jgi:outer membrane protein OmpA-like peptidoglycan-associated protein/tetratricopeptide (TPR) repeat protein
MKRLFFYIFFYFCATNLIAQNASVNKLMGLGLKKFEAHQYGEALKNFEQVLNLDPNNTGAKLYAGVCYIYGDNPIKGLEYLSSLKKTDEAKNPLFHYWLGKAYYLNEKFDEAEQEINSGAVKQIPELINNINDLKIYIRNAKDLKKLPSKSIVQNLGPNVNSPEHEYGSFLSNDYSTLYFTREPSVVGQRLENLEQGLISSLSEDGLEWSAPKLLKFNSSETKVEVPIQLFDNDEKLLLYYNGDIGVSEKTEEGWSEPKPFEFSLANSRAEESHAFLFNKGKSIIFSSKINEKSDLNLYISHYSAVSSEWSQPRPIAELNTLKNDDSPFVTEDGTLYFASEGHSSVGGYDIFMSKFDSASKRWQTPTNLGFPINSVYDDIFFVKSGPYGYFTSNRNGGYGLEDIYIAYLENTAKLEGEILAEDGKELAPFEVLVVVDGVEYRSNSNNSKFSIEIPINKKGKIKILKDKKIIHEEEINTTIPLNGKKIKPIKIKSKFSQGIAQDKQISIVGKLPNNLSGVEINVIDLNDGKVVSQTKTQANGNFKINNLKYGSKSNYQLTAISKGVVVAKSSISAKNIRSGDVIDLGEIETLESVEVGSQVVMEKIYFDFNSFVIREVSYPVLDKLVTYLSENKTIKIEISGHTDSIGKDEYNQQLSEMRAKSVFNYLVGKGIEKTRLKPIGYGEKSPIASNDDELDGRELNRRIEFKVLSK